MKYRKLMLLLFLAVSQFAFSQANCDIAQGGLEVKNSSNTSSVSSIQVGGTAKFKFSLYNAGTDPGCVIPINKVQVVLSFPTITGGLKPYIYNGPASFNTGMFTWTYDASNEVLVGENTSPVPNDGTADVVLVPVLGNAVGAATMPLNISVSGGIDNNTANDASSAPLNVVAPISLPIILDEFSGKADNCNALVKWSTSFESNLSKFEIESSSNGVDFTKIGSVDAKNATTGASYQFNWNQANNSTFYRLKVIDKDGSITYSKVVNIVTNCNGKKQVKLFPNPVKITEFLSVNISGYGKIVKGELFSATGQLVKSYKLLNGTNELSLDQLTQGLYTLKVSENGELTETFKVQIMK
jgi:hypothetical protein